MYYKILNRDMQHFGMQYHEGLNINCEETVYDETPGKGLYFADKYNIMSFCQNGALIADVTLPRGERFIAGDDGYKANQIILSYIRPLWTKETFAELLNDGVDIHIAGEYVLRVAISNNNLEMVQYIINHLKNNITPQFAATSKNKTGFLAIAARCGYLEIVKYLVQQNQILNSDFELAVQYAAKHGNIEVVRYLVDQGANIHANRELALRLAVENNNMMTAKFLCSLF